MSHISVWPCAFARALLYLIACIAVLIYNILANANYTIMSLTPGIQLRKYVGTLNTLLLIYITLSGRGYLTHMAHFTLRNETKFVVPMFNARFHVLQNLGLSLHEQ